MHTVTRVYNNGDRVTTHFASTEEMENHLAFSITARFGCAHFRDGKCVSFGYLGQQRCEAIEKELKNRLTASTAQR